MSSIAVFFFYPRKLKVPKKPFFVNYFDFFLGWKYFSRPLSRYLFGHSEVFTDRFSDFSRVEFSFSRSERRILTYFFIFDGIFFFFVCEILLFFLWHILLLGQFSKLCLGQFEISSGWKFKIFSEGFFLSGIKFKNYVSPPPK